MEPILPVVIISGLLDSLNPCAISILLLFVALLFTLKKSRKIILTFGFFYILAIYITYLFIGLGLLKVVHFFHTPHLFAKIAAWLVIILGILNIKEYFFPDLPLKIRIPFKARELASKWAYKASIPASIVLGVLVGICEFPCSGAVYLAVVGLLSVKTSFLKGTAYLLIYNVMFVLPLVLIYLLASNRRITEKMINWQEGQGRKMHLVLAGLMIGLGVFILIFYV